MMCGLGFCKESHIFSRKHLCPGQLQSCATGVSYLTLCIYIHLICRGFLQKTFRLLLRYLKFAGLTIVAAHRKFVMLMQPLTQTFPVIIFGQETLNLTGTETKTKMDTMTVELLVKTYSLPRLKQYHLTPFHNTFFLSLS